MEGRRAAAVMAGDAHRQLPSVCGETFPLAATYVEMERKPMFFLAIVLGLAAMTAVVYVRWTLWPTHF